MSCYKKYFCETQMPCCVPNDKVVEPERWMDFHWHFLLTMLSTIAERFFRLSWNYFI